MENISHSDTINFHISYAVTHVRTFKKRRENEKKKEFNKAKQETAKSKFQMKQKHIKHEQRIYE